MQQIASWFIPSLLIVLFCHVARTCGTIGCYMCSSYNYTDPYCHDPFDPYYSVYREKCFQGKPKHKGEFPASYCIKIKGTRLHDGVELVVRRCSLNRLTELDSKIGLFQFEEHMYDGYVSTCVTDGCNAGNPVKTNAILVVFGVISTFLYRMANHWT